VDETEVTRENHHPVTSHLTNELTETEVTRENHHPVASHLMNKLTND